MTEREDRPDLFNAAPARDATTTAGSSLGGRLRAARELRGLTLAHCANRLHLPSQVLQRLEADDFGSPEHFVFLRGALQGYARFLELPADACDDALRAAAPAAPPELVSVARTSPARWLLQRYGTAATYIVLTAFIAVPLVLLGLRGGLHRPTTRLVSLDQVAQPAQHRLPATPAMQPQQAPAVPTVTPDSVPFRASMSPFAAIGLRDDNSPSAPPAASPDLAAGQHTLTLTASADCWFDITDASGDKVASGMLHAGDTRTFAAGGALHVTLGNADGVTATADGKPVDLAAYQRANVARLDLFAPVASAGEND